MVTIYLLPDVAKLENLLCFSLTWTTVTIVVNSGFSHDSKAFSMLLRFLE